MGNIEVFEKEEVYKRRKEVYEQFLAQFKGGIYDPKKYILCNKDKYNQKKVVQAEVNDKYIDLLLEHDKKIKGLPQFMHDFLNLKPSRHRETLYKRPELIQWSPDNRWVLMPCPAYTNHEQLIENPKLARLNPEGFGLIVWYVHPNIYKNCRYKNKDKIIKELIKEKKSLRYGTLANKENLNKLKRINSYSDLSKRKEDIKTTLSHLDESGEKYLCGPFDFTKEHLNSLKYLRDMILIHLVKIYGITPSDKVELYFHTHYNIATTTTHMHVRVNQYHHGLELDKSLTLDEIIMCLSKGERVRDLFKKRCVILKDSKSYDFLKNTGYLVKWVDNPYLVD